MTKAGVFQKQKYLPLLHVANRHEYSLRRLVQHYFHNFKSTKLNLNCHDGPLLQWVDKDRTVIV